MNYKQAVDNIRKELKEYVEGAQLKSLVLGISGGIDSTLVALLAKPVCDELNIPLIGRSLPTSSNAGGENSRASEIGELFCTDFKETDIHSQFVDLAYMVYEDKGFIGEGTGHPHGDSRVIQNGNIKARIRMIYLYDLASVNKGLVLSTDNYTEYLLGFWTLHGDVGDYGMIQEMWKTDVYGLTEWIMWEEYKSSEERSAIQKVIDADATDGLGISNTDLDQILPSWEGSSRDGYFKVDEILKGFNMLLKNAAKTPKVIKAMDKLSESPVIQRQIRTEFKRKNPLNIPINKINPES